MKICISSTGPNLTDQVDARFGRCPYFLFVDSESSKLLKSVVNQSVHSMQGAGITAAQLVANEKVEAVITGNVGPNAFHVLTISKIKIYTGVFNMTVETALAEFKKGQLQQLTSQPVGGMGRGIGRGGGFGPAGGGRARRGFGNR